MAKIIKTPGRQNGCQANKSHVEKKPVIENKIGTDYFVFDCSSVSWKERILKFFFLTQKIMKTLYALE